jgi:hypothetical protein
MHESNAVPLPQADPSKIEVSFRMADSDLRQRVRLSDTNEASSERVL